jgi:hypothetical protein
MTPEGFEPAIPGIERLRTHALECNGAVELIPLAATKLIDGLFL